LTPFQTEVFALQLLNNDRRAIHLLLEQGSTDISYAVGERARFRVNIFSGRGAYAIVMRRLAARIPTVEELRLPSILNDIGQEKNGLVLVTGATGSGKSSTWRPYCARITPRRAHSDLRIGQFAISTKATFNRRSSAPTLTPLKWPASGVTAGAKDHSGGRMRDRPAIEIALHAAETGHNSAPAYH
jgi:twitching motility protein PilT